MIKKVSIIVLVVLVLVFGGLYLTKPNVVVPTPEANPGPDSFVRAFFNSGLTEGGVVATTTTAATYTTTASDFNGTPSVWAVTPNVITTISLSSTSTFAYVPKVGDVATIIIQNASTTAGANITLAAASANLDLQKNEDVADLAIAGTDYARITLVRKSGYDVTAIYENFVVAD